MTRRISGPSARGLPSWAGEVSRMAGFSGPSGCLSWDFRDPKKLAHRRSCQASTLGTELPELSADARRRPGPATTNGAHRPGPGPAPCGVLDSVCRGRKSVKGLWAPRLFPGGGSCRQSRSLRWPFLEIPPPGPARPSSGKSFRRKVPAGVSAFCDRVAPRLGRELFHSPSHLRVLQAPGASLASPGGPGPGREKLGPGAGEPWTGPRPGLV